MLEQLLAHLWGDYILQSDWMARNKTKAFLPAAIHALVYSLLFLPLCWMPQMVTGFGPIQSAGDRVIGFPDKFHPLAFAVIVVSHFFIDRYRLARYVVWAKNWIAPAEHRYISEIQEWHRIPANWPWADCVKTGYPPDCPEWMAVWLMIIADNTLHLTINYAALRWL